MNIAYLSKMCYRKVEECIFYAGKVLIVDFLHDKIVIL